MASTMDPTKAWSGSESRNRFRVVCAGPEEALEEADDEF